MEYCQHRRHLRVAPSHLVFVEYPNHLAKVKNLSVSGAYIEDRRPLPVGERIRFKLWLDDFHAINTEAAIRHRQEEAGMGVEFLRMDSRSAGQLRQALDRYAQA